MGDKKKKPLIQRQKVMFHVLYALIPLILFSLYLYGWRTLLILTVVNGAGFLSEYLFARIYQKQVSAAVFVTNCLYALSLPPAVPLWIAVVGIVFGVVFGKMVFGGFGRNVFNPAISGRAFVYISFGAPLTASFVSPATGIPGGFSHWLHGVDAVSRATPRIALLGGEPFPRLDLFLGTTAGSLGETSALLILLGAAYLIWKKAASWRIMAAVLIGFLTMHSALYFGGVVGVIDPLTSLFTGSILFALVFMATDPVSSSQSTDGGRWIYGITIGVLVSLIRVFSIWIEGVTFAILLANMYAPLLDHYMKEAKKKKKQREAAA
jgi:Na+-transporting NADH:ubiquinone oxidoreductase subunit B